jgi:hypothetical protein
MHHGTYGQGHLKRTQTFFKAPGYRVHPGALFLHSRRELAILSWFQGVNTLGDPGELILAQSRSRGYEVRGLAV